MRNSWITGLFVIVILVSWFIAFKWWITAPEKVSGVVESGDIVYVTYTANLIPNGELVDEQVVPMKMTIGDGNILHAVDNELLGMKKWETKSFTVKPEDGFGSNYDNGLIRVLPARYFTVGGRTVNKGSEINVDGKNGIVIGVQGSEGDQLLTIDLNHKFTYTDLNYTIKIHQIGGNEFKAENI